MNGTSASQASGLGAAEPPLGDAAQDLDDVSGRLYLAMGRLVRMLRRHNVGELGPGSFSALATLARCGPMRLGDLATRENVAPPTLTRIVAGLEQSGYVMREVDPDDRRAVRVAATESGTAITLGMRSARAAALRERLATLTPQQQDALVEALGALEALAGDE